MARVTRLELATSGVTGRRSNQLSYTPLKSSDILDRARKSFGQEKIKLNNEIKTNFSIFLIIEGQN